MKKCKGIIIHPDELTEQMIELLKNSNLNVLGIHPTGGRTAAQSLENLLALLRTPDFQNKLNQVREMGFAVDYEVHALSWLVPRELYTAHTDWFRMDEEGKRVNDFNMCPSNPEALEYLKMRATELANILRSDSGRYYFWVDDVKGTRCHCENCRKLNASDQALILYNTILEGIRCVDKEAKQCFLAYEETMEVPSSVKPNEGIFLEYAPMWRDTLIPMNDNTCEKNKEYCDYIQPLLEYFGRQDSQVLEYWLDNSLFSKWKKPAKEIHICEETIRKDIQFYKEQEFEYITTFGCFLSDDYMEDYGIPPIKEYGKCFL